MSEEQPQPEEKSVEPTASTSFWAELKRRKVMRVAITYAVVAWLLIQVSATVFPQFDIPDWGPRFVTLLLVIGFPVALIIAWAFELTPDGIKTTKRAREVQVDSSVSKKQQRRRNWLTIGFAAGLPTLIFGVLAVVFFIKARSAEAEIAASEQAEYDKSIAVLPLENMSPDEANAFFADGVQEDILTNLSKIRELGIVISRSSTLKYKDPDRNLRQVGEELGVRYIVEGSVRRTANQVRVTVQLIDAQTDDHLWAENYDRSLDNIFEIQSEIAKRIADKLQAVISPQENEQIDRLPTESMEAYDNYQKANQLIGATTRMGDEKIAFLEKAVELDPNFAEAWASLATEAIHWWDVDRNRKDPALRARAHEALREAIRSGPGLPNIPLAQNTIAYREDRDIEASIDYLLEALSIDANNSRAKTVLGRRYGSLGRLAEAQHYFEESLRVDPLVWGTNYTLMRVYQERGFWDKARVLIERNLARGDREPYWMRQLAHLNFYRTGDEQAYALEFKRISEYEENIDLVYSAALLSRDYQEVLRHLGEFDEGEFGGLLWGMDLRSRSLAEALILFELGDPANSVVKSKSARTNLEARIAANPLATPNRKSNLLICYALEGDRSRFESSLADVRDYAKSTYWRYNYLQSVEIHIAIAYLIFGEQDKAIDTLEAASDLDGREFFNRELKLWFIFDRLRGYPRFDRLLED